MPRRLLYAAFGLLATLVGVAAGHLVAALLNPDSSPVLAVGSTVIDLTPTPMKEWAIRQFGSNDKPILIGSVMAGVLVLAAVAGLLARRSFRNGAVLLVVLVAIAGIAAIRRPAAELVDVVPGVVSALVAVASLWRLDRSAGRPAPAAPRHAAHPMATQTPAPHGGVDIAEPVAQQRPEPTRRGVLIVMGALGATAAVMGGAGRWIGRIRATIGDLTFPPPASAAEPLPTGLETQFEGITPFRIPGEDFYRVDTRLDTPIVDLEDWTLTIDGDVDNELTFTFDELLEMPLIERDITLTCVSNSVGGEYVGGARWIGVRLTDLLARAGVGSRADQILSTDFDGMTISTPLDLATDGRDAMIALGMNGEALPRAHGYPARMVVPGLYGFIGATKWLTRLTLTTYADQQAYWTERDWATDAPIKPSARIDTPQSLAEIPTGETVIGGVAWAQNDGGVAKVQVKVDGGAWEDATLGPDAGNIYWRQWYYTWDATKGRHSVAARVVDADGEVQTAARAEPFPEGSSGIHTLILRVE
jgi:DMSO/TMAO reductase YedYZ molybdopterin-dependent catalytic subunit